MELAPLERRGWAVGHDLPARFGNDDHLVVGPSGAYLLETKRFVGDGDAARRRLGPAPWNGPARRRLGPARRGTGPRVAWRGDEGLASRLRGSARDARRLLGAANINWVAPVVVLVRLPAGGGRAWWRDVCPRSWLGAWLESQPTTVSAQSVENARSCLRRLEADALRDRLSLDPPIPTAPSCSRVVGGSRPSAGPTSSSNTRRGRSGLVRVGERTRPRATEAHLARDGHDADRERVAAGQRHRRVHRGQPAAADVARHGRPGDARDREVEQARMGERVGERALERRRRERDGAERRRPSPPASPSRRRWAVTAAIASSRATGSGSSHGSSMKTNVIRLPAPAIVGDPADVGGHHRLQRRGGSPRRSAKRRSAPGAGGEHDVVGRHAEAPRRRADRRAAATPGRGGAAAPRRARSAGGRAPAAAACAPPCAGEPRQLRIRPATWRAAPA